MFTDQNPFSDHWAIGPPWECYDYSDIRPYAPSRLSANATPLPHLLSPLGAAPARRTNLLQWTLSANLGKALGGKMVIRIDLVDNSTSVKHIDFKKVPVTKASQFHCNPDGVLPLDSVVRLSRELKAGRTFGETGKFVWYRLVGKAAATYKGLSCGMELPTTPPPTPR